MIHLLNWLGKPALVVVALAAALTAAQAETREPYVTGKELGAPSKLLDCVEIRRPAHLNLIRQNMHGNYCLANDIDLSSEGDFRPIGLGGIDGYTEAFYGIFDGRGNVIRNLTIRASSTEPLAGLFAKLMGAQIMNLHLVNARVLGSRTTTAWPAGSGAIAGYVTGSKILNCFVSGVIVGRRAGGLAGIAWKTEIWDTHSSADTLAYRGAGGLVGQASWSWLRESYAAGNANAIYDAGGLVGLAGGSSILKSHATGRIYAARGAGGLVGSADHSSVSKSYALGPVNGRDRVGGLIGSRTTGGVLRESYAVGRVSRGGGG